MSDSAAVDSARVYITEAKWLIERNHLSSAICQLRQAIILDTTCYEAYTLFGFAANELGWATGDLAHHRRALRYLTAGIDLCVHQPTPTSAYEQLSVARLRAGYPIAAVEAATTALSRKITGRAPETGIAFMTSAAAKLELEIDITHCIQQEAVGDIICAIEHFPMDANMWCGRYKHTFTKLVRDNTEDVDVGNAELFREYLLEYCCQSDSASEEPMPAVSSSQSTNLVVV